METPADRLKKARIDAGYESAKEAADALGANYTTYGQHENGTRGFPSKVAERYARKFKVSIDWLVAGSGASLTMSAKKPTKLGMIPVKGRVKAGDWQDIDGWGAGAMTEWVPASSEYPLAGQMVERTAKRVKRTLNGFELWPESTDPEHQTAIPYIGIGETDRADVVAKVLWILRKP